MTPMEILLGAVVVLLASTVAIRVALGQLRQGHAHNGWLRALAITVAALAPGVGIVLGGVESGVPVWGWLAAPLVQLLAGGLLVFLLVDRNDRLAFVFSGALTIATWTLFPFSLALALHAPMWARLALPLAALLTFVTGRVQRWRNGALLQRAYAATQSLAVRCEQSIAPPPLFLADGSVPATHPYS